MTEVGIHFKDILVCVFQCPFKSGNIGSAQSQFPFTLNHKKPFGKFLLQGFYDGCRSVRRADFSHNPNDLPRLYQACSEQGGDVSIGSRYISGVNVVNWPMGRVLMSYFASKYVRFITGIPVQDTTAGFVCYRRQVLEMIDLDHIRFKGYAFQIEMKFTAYKCGFKIIEVPVIFINRELGTSKMNSSIFGEAIFGVIKLKVNSWFHKFPQKS